MIDAEAFAALLCDWSLEVARGQQVLVTSTTKAVPITLALHAALLKRGAWPLLRLEPPSLRRDFYRYATDAQIDSFAPLELVEAQEVDAHVSIDAPANTRQLQDVDPDLITRAARARSPIQAAARTRRWCRTQWPTAAFAQQAGMSEHAYAAFLARALFLDRPDPVAAWRDLSERQRHLAHRLTGTREIRIEAEGTDLRLRVDGRTWINSDGKRNMPSGELFTGPVEDSANGAIRFTVPTAHHGVEVEGVELRFEDGVVVHAAASRGDAYLQAALRTDAGARRLGELGIGTNSGIDRATGSTLLDEKIAGTVHLALGRSYPETGGENSSALHWDLICDLRKGGTITADGEALSLERFRARSENDGWVQ